MFFFHYIIQILREKILVNANISKYKLNLKKLISLYVQFTVCLQDIFLLFYKKIKCKTIMLTISSKCLKLCSYELKKNNNNNNILRILHLSYTLQISLSIFFFECFDTKKHPDLVKNVYKKIRYG